MDKQKHIVIFSHGFGVKKDDLGMLTDIADTLENTECILFDYFSVDEENKTLTVTTFSEQVNKLREVYNKVRENNPEAIVDIIGHSQGTLIPVLADLPGIRKTILLNPPFDMGVERTFERYATKPGCEINLEGMSKLYRVGGYERLIPKEYWTERAAIKTPTELFNYYSEKTELTIINANQDTILGDADTSGLNSKVKVISLDGDHNFNGEHRLKLKEVIKEILCN